MSVFLNQLWYGNKPLVRWLLYPLSLLYRMVVAVRRVYLLTFCHIAPPVPLIVVGNITVGGVGKTPLVIELALRLKDKGLKVGIVSRGYGSRIKHFPYEVKCHDDAHLVGDEPLLIAQKTQCPVVIAPQRTKAVNYLVTNHQCELIISDDGLQHYRMARSIELVVIDGTRQLGNGLCLPAGPLREPKKRLREVDFIVVNEGSWNGAYAMSLKPAALMQLRTLKSIPFTSLSGEIVAVAGIGNPQRFYSTLTQLGIKFTAYSYPDHYQFKPDDFAYGATSVIMTEKDAIKCRSFANDEMYFLTVRAVIEDSFWDALWSHQHIRGLLKL